MMGTLDTSRLTKEAARLEDGAVRFLRDIVSLPSESTHEEKVARRILQEMERLGFDEAAIDPMGNVLGRVGSGPRKVLFDAHMDTVGVGDPKSWTYDPYQGKVEGKSVFGRGASDNKGAAACQVYAGKLIKDLGLAGDASVYVCGTVQEEDCDGLALRYVIEHDVRPEAVVLGECTDLAVYRGHRGRVEIKVSTAGVSCHASAPERGKNAIYRMVPIIQGIEGLHGKLANDPFLGPGSIAVTKIECQTGSLNCVPDRCDIYIDRRLTAGETRESAVEEIRGVRGGGDAEISILRYQTKSWKGLVFETEKYFPTWVLAETHPLFRAGVSAGKTALGREPAAGKWTFSTNGIASMGQLGIPTIGFGPSREEYAHTTIDQCPIDHILKSIAFYAAFPSAYSAAVR